jgi:hypothetical protein
MRRTIERLRAEFLEMPGLRLNVVQIQRLCGVDDTTCQGVIDALVAVKFLRANPDGTYARLSDGDRTRVRPPMPQPKNRLTSERSRERRHVVEMDGD